MARLPVPGDDEGQWGEILNDFLLQSHDSDGTIKADAVDSASLQDDSISGAKLQDGAVSSSKLSLSGGSDGNLLVKNSIATGGLEWSAVPSGQIYPLEGYGFHSASVSPETASGSSFFTGWQTRVWVPAYKTITKAATFITTAATGAATFAGFAVYSDDGQTLLGQGTDNTVFLTTGLPEIAMASSIAAQASGRFVHVLVTSNYSGSAPNCPFSIDGGPANGIVWNSGPVIRSAYFNSITSFPATIDPATGAGLSGWTPTNYMPIILLG
jgi:hypothetical protein